MWGAEPLEQGWDEGRKGHLQDHMGHGRGWTWPVGALWSVLSGRDKMGAHLALVWYSPSQRPNTACPGRGPSGRMADTQHGWHLVRR